MSVDPGATRAADGDKAVVRAAANTVDVPPDGTGLRIALVVARFNELITRALLRGAEAALLRAGVAAADTTTVWVPGAWELPVAALWLAESGRCDAVVCIGAVIRGETDHYTHIAAAATNGAAQVALTTRVPVANAILTVDTAEQALARCGIKHGNKGGEAAMAAVEMAGVRRVMEGS